MLDLFEKEVLLQKKDPCQHFANLYKVRGSVHVGRSYIKVEQ